LERNDRRPFEELLQIDADSSENDQIVDDITNLLRDYNILDCSDNSSIRDEVEQCLHNDDDDSELFKNTLIEEIDQAMETALRIESDGEYVMAYHKRLLQLLVSFCSRQLIF
jgi:hypothetical protein